MTGTKAAAKKGGAPPPKKATPPAAQKSAQKSAAAAPAKKSAAPQAAAQKQAAATTPKKASKAAPEAAAVSSASIDGGENERLNVPHRFKLNTKERALMAYCDLPRVPAKYVQCDPTNDDLVVSTPEWTRKYFLSVPYPDGIKVNGDAAEAEFDGKILTVKLPITNFPEEAREKQAKISEDIRKGKELRFKDEIGKGWKALQENIKAAKASEEQAKQRAVSAVSGATTPGVTPGSRGVAPSAVVEMAEEKAKKKSKTFLNDDASRLKELMEAAGEAEADRVASKQQKMTLLQQMRMEAKQAKLEKKTRRREQQQESVSKVLQQRKRTLDETNPGVKDGKKDGKKDGRKGGQGGKPAKKARKN